MPTTQPRSRCWEFVVDERDEDFASFVEKLSCMRYLAYTPVPETDHCCTRGWVYTEHLRSKKYMLQILPSVLWRELSYFVKNKDYLEAKSLGTLTEIGSAPNPGRRVDLEGERGEKRKQGRRVGLEGERSEKRKRVDTPSVEPTGEKSSRTGIDSKRKHTVCVEWVARNSEKIAFIENACPVCTCLTKGLSLMGGVSCMEKKIPYTKYKADVLVTLEGLTGDRFIVVEVVDTHFTSIKKEADCSAAGTTMFEVDVRVIGAAMKEDADVSEYYLHTSRTGSVICDECKIKKRVAEIDESIVKDRIIAEYLNEKREKERVQLWKELADAKERREEKECENQGTSTLLLLMG
jgi:hypothetical protein